jgi:glucose/arabinose dehydrogenase
VYKDIKFVPPTLISVPLNTYNRSTSRHFPRYLQISATPARMLSFLSLSLLVAITPLTAAQSCSANPPTPTNSIKTSWAAGYISQVVATGLTKPRSLEFDAAGHLLVLEQGRGLTSFPLVDAGGVCVTLGVRGDLVENGDVSLLFCYILGFRGLRQGNRA